MAEPPPRLTPDDPYYGFQGAPEPGNDPSATRSLPRAAIDFGLGVGRIVPETYQTVVEGGRTLFGGDQPTGWWQRRAKEAGDTMDWYKGLSSVQDQRVGEKKFFPGVDDQSAWSDLPAVAAHQIAGLVPYLFGGVAAKAVTKTPEAAATVAKIFNIGAMGTQQYGAYNQALRDYFEKTPLDQLNSSVPGFSELASQMGEDVARNEAYKKAWSPVAAVLNAGVGAIGGAGISHAVGGMEKAFLPRVAIGTAEGLGIGGSLGAAGEYGRQKGLVNVGAQGAIDTEKMYRAAGESALPMGAIVGTTHGITGGKKAAEAKGDAAETPPPSGGPPMAETAALTEALGGGQGELNLPPRPPSDQYGLALPLPRDRPQFTGYQPPEEPPPPPPPPGPEQGRLDLRAPPRSIGGMGELGEYEAHLREQEAQDAAHRALAQQQSAGYARAAAPPQLDPDLENRIVAQRQARGLAGLARQRELQPTTPELEQAQLRLPDQRAPAFPSGAPPLDEYGLRTLAEQGQGLRKPPPRGPTGTGGPPGGGGPTPPPAPTTPVSGGRVMVERARAAQEARARTEKGTSQSVKTGDTIVDTDGTRMPVVGIHADGPVVRLEGTDLVLPHGPEQLTIERAPAAALAEKPKAAAKAPPAEKPKAAAKGHPEGWTPEWQAEAERIDHEEREAKPAIRAKLAKDGKTFFNDDPAGGWVATDGGMNRKVKIHPTAEETKAAKRANQLGDIAGTPEERAEAKKAFNDALRPALDRALAEKQTVPPLGEAKPTPAAEPKPATPEDNIRQVIFHAAGGDNNIRDRWATRLRGIAHAKGRLEHSDLPPELRAALNDGPLLRRLMDDPVSFDRMVRGTEPVEVPELPAGLRREPPGAARVAEVSKRRTAEAKGETKTEEPKEKLQAPVSDAEAAIVAKLHPAEREQYDKLRQDIADEIAGYNDPDVLREMRQELADWLEDAGLPQEYPGLPKFLEGASPAIKRRWRRQNALSPEARAENEKARVEAEAKAIQEAEDAVVHDWVPPNKPEGFDSPTAKELRKRMRPPGHPKGLPQSWEELVKVVRGQNMLDYLRAQVEALQKAGKVATGELGQVYVGQAAATVVRRLEKMGDREPLVAASIDEGWQGTDKNLLQKAAAAAAGVEFDPDRPPPFIGPMQAASPIQRRAARREWFNEIRERERSTEAPDVVATAKEALAVMEKQLEAWKNNLTKYIQEEYPNRKYVHGQSPRDEVMMMPTDRGGGANYPQWSRIVQINMKADMFRDLIGQAEQGRSSSRRYSARRSLKTQLGYWASDETMGAEIAHEGRKLSSLEMTEAHEQPTVTDDEGNKVYGVDALEAGAPGGFLRDAEADVDPLAAVEAGEGTAGRPAIAEAPDPRDVAEAEAVGFYGQGLKGQGATLERSTEAQLISQLLKEYDEVEAVAKARGETIPSREELLARLHLQPDNRTALDELAKVNPELAAAFDESMKRNALITYDPETGTQRTREFFETDPATGEKKKLPTLQEWDPGKKEWKNVVRPSLVEAEAEGNVVRRAAGQTRITGLGAIGEAMIREGVLSEETAHRLVSSGNIETVDWARETSLNLGRELTDILRHVAAALRGEATSIRATTGEREVIERTKEQAQREQTAEDVDGVRYTTIPPVRHATAAEQSRLLRSGRSDIANHLDEVADQLAEHAVTATSYSGRKPAIERLMQALDDQPVRQAFDAERKRNNLPGEPLADSVVDWFLKNDRVDKVLQDVESRLAPGEMEVPRAWAQTTRRGDPVLTPITSGSGLSPADVRARVTEGRPTVVQAEPSKEDLFVPLPHNKLMLSDQEAAENEAALRARTGIYARNPRDLKQHVVSPLRNVPLPEPARETVVLPDRPSIAEYERRRGEPAPVDERGRVGMTGEERLADFQSAVNRVVDYLFERKKPARYPEEITDDELVKASPVKDLSHEIYDRSDRIDQELKKVADQTVGDVQVMVLHPDIFNGLMKRLGVTEENKPGYYDWRTDTIYLNKDKSDARTMAEAEAWNTLMRHEVGHAMTFGAIEENPRAKSAIKMLTDMISTRKDSWAAELKAIRDEGRKPSLSIKDIEDRLKDPHEFLQELQANKDFRRIMAGVQLSAAERTRLRTPQARTIFEAAKEWITRAVKDLFRRSRGDDALTDGLAMTFEILQDTIERGRPEFNPRRKYEQTGAPGFWDSALGEKLGETGREVKYRYKKQGGTWGQKAFWTQTFEDLTRWGNEAFKAKTRPTKEIISELYTEAHNYARERGDEPLLHALSKMQSSPNADRFADFALRRSKMQAYTEAPLGEKDANGKATGMNAHVRIGSMLHRQIERIFPRMQAEHEKIMRDVPYAKELLKMMDDWGAKVAKDDALAVIHDTAGMDNITRDKDGNIDPLAQSAFEKYVVNNKDTPLTPAEQAWIDSKRGPDPRTVTGEKAKQDAFLKRINFDKLVASYRDNPDLARRAGPWVPFKRFGDHAISGDYVFPEPEGGRHIDRGMFEFYDDAAAERMIDRVTDTLGVKLLDTDRVAYVKDPSKPREEWVEAQKEDERSQWEGGNVDEPGYVVTTRQGTRRVTPKEAEKDPALEIRRRLNFNDRHVEFFRKEREAQERLDEMNNKDHPKYNPNVKMRGEVELVSDYGGSQSPHYMSRAMRGLIENATNSWEYKRMTPGERRAWKQRLMTAAAKQVMMAGGRAPGLMREYVEGQSRDLLEAYAMASAQSAFNHAHYKHGQRLRDAFKAIDEHNFQYKDSAGSSDRRAVSEELQRRAYAVHDPFVHGIWGTATNRLLQFTYTAKLAGTSFLGLNMMEPWLIYLPMLAAKVGPWQAFRLMKGAYSDLAGRKILGKGIADFKKAAFNREGKWADYQETFAENLRDSKAADAEDAIRMFDVLLSRGMFDRSSVNEVTVLRAEKPTWAGKVLDWADNSFRGLNTGVEALNRGAIALSAFRGAKGTFEERVRAAEDAVYRGAGVYAAWNAPPIFNHPVGRLAMQFKKYPQRIISNHIAALMAGLNGETPEARALGFKTLGYMLGTTAMVAGMMGLPTEVFSIPFNALSILGLGPSWSEITAGAYGIMANQLGPEAAEVIAHGAPRLFNVDLSGRAGQNNLLFFDQPQSNKPQDLKASIAGFLMGAGGSSLMSGIEGIQLTGKALSEAVSGSSERASQYAMQAARDLMFVKVGADILDAIRKSGVTGGMRTNGGAALGPELTAGETAMRVLGVQSGREARYWEGRQVEQRREKEGQASRTMWVQRMATATPAERPSIQTSINEWNQTHGLADQVKPSEIAKAISRRRTEEARPRSDMAMPRNKRYQTERQDVSRIYNLQGL